MINIHTPNKSDIQIKHHLDAWDAGLGPHIIDQLLENPTPPPPGGDKILLEDNVFFLMMEDNTSFLLMET